MQLIDAVVHLKHGGEVEIARANRDDIDRLSSLAEVYMKTRNGPANTRAGVVRTYGTDGRQTGAHLFDVAEIAHIYVGG